MDTSTIAGLVMLVFAIPGLLFGLARMGGKWSPSKQSGQPNRWDRNFNVGIVVFDSLLLIAGITLLLHGS